MSSSLLGKAQTPIIEDDSSSVFVDAKEYNSNEGAVSGTSSSCDSMSNDDDDSSTSSSGSEQDGSSSSSCRTSDSSIEEQDGDDEDVAAVQLSRAKEEAARCYESERQERNLNDEGIPLMVRISTTDDSLCGESHTSAGTTSRSNSIGFGSGGPGCSGCSDRSLTTKGSVNGLTGTMGLGLHGMGQCTSLRRRKTAPTPSTVDEESPMVSGSIDRESSSRSVPIDSSTGGDHSFVAEDPIGGVTSGPGSASISYSGERIGSASVRSGGSFSAELSACVSKNYTTASGLPPSCQLRDAQFLKVNYPESHWAPDVQELEHLEALMNVQCTLVCSYDASLRESFWVTLTKVMRKKRATGATSQICVGYVTQSLQCCELPRGSQIVLLPKHVQKVDRKSADILFQKMLKAEEKQKEQLRIRPILPGSEPYLA